MYLSGIENHCETDILRNRRIQLGSGVEEEEEEEEEKKIEDQECSAVQCSRTNCLGFLGLFFRKGAILGLFVDESGRNFARFAQGGGEQELGKSVVEELVGI
jgi:hypothetical protein